MAQGLVPVSYKSGAPYNGACNRYSVAAGETNNIFTGDPVILSGTGDADGVPGVARAGAGDRISGVVVGFTTKEAADAGDTTAIDRGYRTAGEDDYILVADDPMLLFEATEDGVGGFLAVTSIGLNVDLAVGAGNTVTKRSGYVLDSSTAATTTAGVRVNGLSQRINNTIGSTSTVWRVSIIESTATPAAGTTGI